MNQHNHTIVFNYMVHTHSKVGRDNTLQSFTQLTRSVLVAIVGGVLCADTVTDVFLEALSPAEAGAVS